MEIALLAPEEQRILGCLIEKKMATPEYYPLSLNALTNACNQKSNRNPVVSYSEDTVVQTIDLLKEKNIVSQSNVSRVPKYEELLVQERSMINEEAAIICILLLRGPQTAGEIRNRTERLYSFEGLEQVNNTLENLIALRYVKRLERQPGRKEVRYSHLFQEITESEGEISTSETDAIASASDPGRIEALEEKVAQLTEELSELKEMFNEFKKQFE